MKDNARQSLNFSIDCLSSENDLYRSLLEDKFASMEHVDGDCRSIDVKYFLENENGRQLLFEWVRRYGFNFNQAESMYEAMKNGKSGVMFYNDNIRHQDTKTPRHQDYKSISWFLVQQPKANSLSSKFRVQSSEFFEVLKL